MDYTLRFCDLHFTVLTRSFRGSGSHSGLGRLAMQLNNAYLAVGGHAHQSIGRRLSRDTEEEHINGRINDLNVRD